jgi:hypothetical protein
MRNTMMSTEQVASDLLSRLKRYAEQNKSEPWIPVKATELLALVECAEVMQLAYLVPSETDDPDWWNSFNKAMNKLRAL